jgi:drug/metabolite transporter (DMT)-like permease
MSIEDVAFTLKTVSSSRTAAVIGIIAAIAGPVAIIAFGGSEASNLPWFVWAIVLLALLLVAWRGYYLFTVTHDAKDISISPDRR